jgi:hypothetical protein
MKSKTLLLLLIVPVSILIGQSRYQIFRTYPTNLALIYEFNFAYETNFDNNNSIEILLGSSIKEHIYHVPIFMLSIFEDYDYNSDEILPSKNALTRISYKRYFGRGDNTPFRYFYATQLLMKYSFINNYIYEDFYDGRYSELVDIQKAKIGINLLFGKNYINHNFTLGWHIGLGMRYTYYYRTQYWEEYFPENDEIGETDGYFFHDKKTRSHYGMIKPSVNFGISLGYYKKYQ